MVAQDNGWILGSYKGERVKGLKPGIGADVANRTNLNWVGVVSI